MTIQAEQQDHHHEHADHDHSHATGMRGFLQELIQPHSHDHGDLAADRAFADNEAGIRTVWLALAALTVTSLLQIVIVFASGSVALLADTAHNIGDGLNSIPLLIAFYLARKAATTRFTYGYGRAEDVAGIVIVLSILVSAGIIFWESFQRLFDPQPLEALGWVAVAALIGFLGNEFVALLQIRVGRRIDSAALGSRRSSCPDRRSNLLGGAASCRRRLARLSAGRSDRRPTDRGGDSLHYLGRHQAHLVSADGCGRA